MWVQNVNGSSDRSPTCPKCGSWKQHWLNYSGARVWPEHCSVKGCTNPAHDGAHVQFRHNGNWYIVPLCKACNGKRGQSLELCDDTRTASANRAETCGV